jgi:hypothetical protein
MERDRDAARADLAEQDEAVEGSEAELTEVGRDAGEADVLDQHRAARPGDESDEPESIPADVPEADALEQARAVPDDEELRDA